MLDDMLAAISLVFSKKEYVAMAAASGAALLLAYLAVPVLLIPGSSFRSVLSMMSIPEIAATVLLSALMGIALAMQVFAWRNNAHRMRYAGAGLAGFVSGSLSILFSTASCASCMSAVFSLIGFGGTTFIFHHRTEMMALTFLILGVSLYFTSRRIAGKCASCSIPDAQGEEKQRE